MHFWHDVSSMTLKSGPLLLSYCKTADRKYAVRSDRMSFVCHRVSSASCRKGTRTLEESMNGLEVDRTLEESMNGLELDVPGVPVTMMIVSL